MNDSKVNELKLNDKQGIIILDPDDRDVEKLNSIKEKDLLILNKKETTTSKKIYEISKNLDIQNKDLVYITLLSLENIENEQLLEEAQNQITKIKGLKILGSNTRQLHKTLELSIEPFIIGLSGSEENSLNLLKDIGINLKNNDYWNSIETLNETQKEKLIGALSLSSYSEENLFENRFLLNLETKNSPTRDIHEFNLFLEACIAYKNPTIGLTKCLLINSYKNRALETLNNYRHEIIKALSLYYEKSEIIIEKENYILINFKEKVSDFILGKVSELIQKSKLYPQKKRVICMCQNELGLLKCAISYEDLKIDQNLKNLLNSLESEIKLNKINEVYILLETNQDNESKLLKLISENLESVRIEEVI